MPNQQYPIESLKEWQDALLDIAKKKLRDDGLLHPVAFVLTERMNIDEKTANVARVLGENGPAQLLSDCDTRPTDTLIIVIDLLLSPAQGLSVIQQTVDPVQAGAIAMMVETGRTRFGVQNPEEKVFLALMQHLGIQYKDVISRAIELVIKKTDAIAIVKIDESWTVETFTASEYEKWKGSIEDHPDAKEVIMSFLETEDFYRMVSVPFRRNRPKTGRIVGFGDPKIFCSDKEDKMSGRFTNFFTRVNAEREEKRKTSPSPSAN